MTLVRRFWLFTRCSVENKTKNNYFNLVNWCKINSTDWLMTGHWQLSAPINYFQICMKVTHLSVTANPFINVPMKLFGSNFNSRESWKKLLFWKSVLFSWLSPCFWHNWTVLKNQAIRNYPGVWWHAANIMWLFFLVRFHFYFLRDIISDFASHATLKTSIQDERVFSCS